MENDVRPKPLLPPKPFRYRGQKFYSGLDALGPVFLTKPDKITNEDLLAEIKGVKEEVNVLQSKVDMLLKDHVLVNGIWR